jgi:hypothetical protein
MKVIAGRTTLEEVLRVTKESALDNDAVISQHGNEVERYDVDIFW